MAILARASGTAKRSSDIIIRLVFREVARVSTTSRRQSPRALCGRSLELLFCRRRDWFGRFGRWAALTTNHQSSSCTLCPGH
jgi:hypothetical protein